ncbi:MAG: sulfate permease [Chloroflexi bacterium]|nr:sulfate permease [Chloroflexota bacterium]
MTGSFRSRLQELCGALGDLGTLLPIAVALVTINQVNATGVFLVVGLAYMMAGGYYRLPVPVQPLKAVAAIAIAGVLPAAVISASGLLMAGLLLVIAVTGLVNQLGRLFSKAVIRGIQLGVGLLLVKTGVLLVSRRQVVIGGGEGSIWMTDFSLPAGWLIALVLGAVFLLLLKNKKLPASLILLSLGIPVGMFWGSLPGLKSLQLGLSLPVFTLPGLADMSSALILLVIPQLPLTLGNAVFATVDTAKTYFGPSARRVTPKALLTTMGIANLGAGLLGGMPVCHGSGGLTAHYRLGARSGSTVFLLGAAFAGMAVLLNGNIIPVFALIPYAILGILVIFVGIQHSLLVRDVKGAGDILVTLAIAISGVATSNLTVGLAFGITLHLLLKLARRKAGRVPGSYPEAREFSERLAKPDLKQAKS